MDIDTQAYKSGSAVFSDVVGDHGGQAKGGRAEIGSFSPSLF